MEITFAGLILPHFKIILNFLLVLGFSATITGLVKRYAPTLDIPNERSSHQIPTPRGGGIAIVATFTLAILALSYLGYIEAKLVWTLLVGGTAIALIGYCDDMISVKIRWRILVHFLAAIWALYWLGGISALDFGTWKIALHGAGSLLAIIGIVWCINLYNFMDGIDGLAGSEGIFIGLASGIALWLIGAHSLALILWLLAASIGGFTLWNWPPAKIFLGDVGSGFLGYTFAVLGLYSVNKGLLPFSFWWIIAAVFVCDATITLLCRMYQGKRWYSAHREHAFQHLIFYGANHKQITLSVIVINCSILLPAAYATLQWPGQSTWIMWSTTIALALIWAWIKSLQPGSFSNNLEMAPSSESTSVN